MPSTSRPSSSSESTVGGPSVFFTRFAGAFGFAATATFSSTFLVAFFFGAAAGAAVFLPRFVVDIGPSYSFTGQGADAPSAPSARPHSSGQAWQDAGYPAPRPVN